MGFTRRVRFTGPDGITRTGTLAGRTGGWTAVLLDEVYLGPTGVSQILATVETWRIKHV